MNRLKAWLLLVLVFASGFVGGVFVTRASVRHFVQRAVKEPDFMRERIERRMAVRLRLDSQQRIKVHEILMNTQHELKNLRADFQPRFQSVMNQTRTEIESTLTPEQRLRFERLREENWLQIR